MKVTIDIHPCLALWLMKQAANWGETPNSVAGYYLKIALDRASGTWVEDPLPFDFAADKVPSLISVVKSQKVGHVSRLP
jgi:hypothetical protein